MLWKTTEFFALWELGINQGGRDSFQMSGIQNEGCSMMELEQLTCHGISLAVAAEHKLENQPYVYVNLQKVKEKMS